MIVGIQRIDKCTDINILKTRIVYLWYVLLFHVEQCLLESLRNRKHTNIKTVEAHGKRATYFDARYSAFPLKFHPSINSGLRTCNKIKDCNLA